MTALKDRKETIQMGKYMRKVKISADVAVMEISKFPLGVWTRARTLALQQCLQSSSAAPTPPTPSSASSDSSCYLQLRSRRLEKTSILKPRIEKPNSPNRCCQPDSEIKANPRSGSNLRVSDSSGISGSFAGVKKQDGCFGSRLGDELVQDCDFGLEASFGENNLDFDYRERSTRESTPCSLIREVDVAAPGSSTRQKDVNAVNRRNRSAILENIPSATEIEEFFARANQQQQRQFIEKYNYDVVNDVPLPGRYEWVRVNP